MEHQYSIINQCLQLLKQSDMPTIKRLRVEIQLIQMKRLLLNEDISHELKSGPCGRDVFEALLNQMRNLCGEGSERDLLPDLMERIGGMLTVLGGDQRVMH
jgi:hypothetical protein